MPDQELAHKRTQENYNVTLQIRCIREQILQASPISSSIRKSDTIPICANILISVGEKAIC